MTGSRLGNRSWLRLKAVRYAEKAGDLLKTTYPSTRRKTSAEGVSITTLNQHKEQADGPTPSAIPDSMEMSASGSAPGSSPLDWLMPAAEIAVPLLGVLPFVAGNSWLARLFAVIFLLVGGVSVFTVATFVDRRVSRSWLPKLLSGLSICIGLLGIVSLFHGENASIAHFGAQDADAIRSPAKSYESGAPGYVGLLVNEVSADLAERLQVPPRPGIGWGALVEEVLPGSPAATAYLQQGDVIQRMNDHEVGKATDLDRDLMREAAGQTIRFTVWRKFGRQNISLTASPR